MIAGKHRRTMHGGCPETTNNRMELTAAIEALNALKGPRKVILHTDSKYEKAPFSPTRPSTGHMRAMWSHQPAGRPVIGMAFIPASLRRSRAVKATAGRRPSLVRVSSISVKT